MRPRDNEIVAREKKRGAKANQGGKEPFVD